MIETHVPPNALPCTDHLGNFYPSINALCRVYNIAPETYKDRLKTGMSQEQALTTQNFASRQCSDPWGNIFDSTSAMCEHYGVERKTYEYRLRHGCTQEEALRPGHKQKKSCIGPDGQYFDSIADLCRTYHKDRRTLQKQLHEGVPLEIALQPKSRGKACYDHLGIRYSSVQAMCVAYKCDPSHYYSRIAKGWTVEKALTTPIVKHADKIKIMAVDHLNNHYSSLKAMCDAWGIKVTTFQARIRRGYSLERALTEKPHVVSAKKLITPHKTEKTVYIDHMGQAYTSFANMCQAFHKSPKTVKKKLNEGMELQDALCQTHGCYKPIVDHNGNEFPSITAMLRAYNISQSRYYTGKKAGWSLEKILSPHDFSRRHMSIDHKGNTYPSETAMCQAYGIHRTTFRKLIQQGLTVEQALTGSISTGKSCKDHLGNNYESITAMCQVYGKDPHWYRDHTQKLGWSVEEALLLQKGRMIGNIKVGKLAYVNRTTGVRNYFCKCQVCKHSDIYSMAEICAHKCE